MSDYIPQDVLVDILTRLPVESLVRFTSVCRSWHSLITSPKFISNHLNRKMGSHSTTSDHLLLRYCTEEPKKEHYSLRSDGNGTFDAHKYLHFPFTCMEMLFVVGSCNGLICLSDDLNGYTNEMFLWNPLIRKSVALPKPIFTYFSHGDFMHSLGFGFDSVTNDFKVVRIVYLVYGDATPKVEVYTLKTERWRDISAKALPFYIRERSRQAYVNGAAHWIAMAEMGSFRNLILSFDMNDEVFREISLPDSIVHVDDLLQQLVLIVFEESLSLIQQYVGIGNDPHCSVWIMKEYGVAASWAKLFRIDLRGGSALSRPLGWRMNGEFLFVTGDGHLVSFDRESGRIMYVGIHGAIGEGECYRHAFYVATYMESLVLLDKGSP